MFKSASKKIIIAAIFVVCLGLAGAVLAQSGDDPVSDKGIDYTLQTPIGSTTKVDDLSDYIRMLYSYFVLASGVLATAMIMFGGYIWITAMGNQTKISRAKEFIFSAVTGLLLALFSYLLLYTVNPEIVALKPLNVPVLEAPTVTGPPVSMCRLSQTGTDKWKLVECGNIVNYGSQNEVKYCMGVVNGNDNDICQISENPFTKSKSGNKLSKMYVPGRGGDTDINNDRECGMVVADGDDWKVGAHCNGPVSEDYYQVNGKWIYGLGRCIMDGNEAIVVQSDTANCKMSDVKSFCNSESNDELKSLCGCAQNMRCIGDSPTGGANNNVCNQLSLAGECTIDTTTFKCDAGIQSQIDTAGLVSNKAKDAVKAVYAWLYANLAPADAEKAARISSLADNSLGQCATNWNCGVCGRSCYNVPGCDCNTGDSCAGTCCGHRENSDHYCGADGSHAIDYGAEEYDYQICMALLDHFGANGAFVIQEGNHLHVGFGQGVCPNPDAYNLTAEKCNEFL